MHRCRHADNLDDSILLSDGVHNGERNHDQQAISIEIDTFDGGIETEHSVDSHDTIRHRSSLSRCSPYFRQFTQRVLMPDDRVCVMNGLGL